MLRPRRSLLLSLLGAAWWLSRTAHAADQPVRLGVVTSRVTGGERLAAELRAALLEALDDVRLPARGARETYLLDAVLTRLTSEEPRGVACTVSLSLRRARGGALVAALRGKARATDERATERELERLALRAAASSGVRRLPEALR